MLLNLPKVLDPGQVRKAREILENAEWTDGNVTAGSQSAKAKNNLQLPEKSAAAKRLGETILEALSRNGTFISAALPDRIFPPLFNCYQDGNSFGTHVDNAIRYLPGTNLRIRTDMSMTLFLSEPDEYEGGELVIEDSYGKNRVKLPAGDMVLYPGTSLHRVTPVTGGRRLASFFWLQSLVASDERRTILFDLDTAIQSLRQSIDDNAEIIQLTGVYHNLLRQWSRPG